MQFEQLIEFLTNHPGLSLAFLALSGGIVWTFVAARAQAGISLAPLDAVRTISGEDALVVDVRGESEFASGHIVNSMNVPESVLKDSPAKLDKHRDKTIVTVCKSGQKSTAVAASLRKQGFDKVYNLRGGLVAWENAGLPLTKK